MTCGSRVLNGSKILFVETLACIPRNLSDPHHNWDFTAGIMLYYASVENQWIH